MKRRYYGGGISIFTVLFIVFLVLKLTNLITWSWWWVTFPLWGPLVLWLVIFLFIIVFMRKRRRYQ